MNAKYSYLQSSAHNMVTLAIRHGDLYRPDTCESCGQRSPKINAHHEDYSKPLEIVWLCYSCHRKLHPETYSQLNKINRVSKKLQAALDWLRDNPGNLGVPSRELEASIGVSHMTIYKAQQIMKEETES